MIFIDSNVWLYALIGGQDIVKSNIAQQLIDVNSGNIGISNQIIGEVISNLKKKSQLTEVEIRHLIIRFYQGYPVTNVDESIMHNASHLRERYSFSYWDSLIVAAAIQVDATTLYSEDMHAGLVIGSRLTIVNPFVA